MDSDRLEWLLAQLPSNPDCEPVRAILMAISSVERDELILRLQPFELAGRFIATKRASTN